MSNRQYDVGHEIDSRRIGAKQWMLFVLCALVILFDGFDIQTVSYTAPFLSKHLGVALSSFGFIFASGLAGLTVGSIAIGPIADRLGRRKLLILFTLIFGVFTLLTLTADSETALVIFRFMAGVGLGGGIPNALALCAEYTPTRARATAIAIIVSATPLGAVVGGLVAGSLIEAFGWQIVFWIGGVAPIIVAVMLVKWLPESIRFMVVSGRDNGEIADVMTHMLPDFKYQAGGKFVLGQQQNQKAGSVSLLFMNKMGNRTLSLWVTNFSMFLLTFLISSWLPSILKLAGFPLQQSVFALVGYQLTGVVGSAVLGRLGDKLGTPRVLSVVFIICVFAVAYLGHPGNGYFTILSLMAIAGFCIQGGISTLYGFAASIYPTAVRVTGIGWASATGRFGAIFGPLVGGAMLSHGWSMQQMFIAAAIPAIVCVLGLMNLARLVRRDAPVFVADVPAAH